MTTHQFDSTGDAYDACQVRDDIKNGDTLVILGEGVVGLADTWPVAITAEPGHLHAHNGAFPLEYVEPGYGKPPTTAQIHHAIATAQAYGFALSETALDFVRRVGEPPYRLAVEPSHTTVSSPPRRQTFTIDGEKSTYQSARLHAIVSHAQVLSDGSYCSTNGIVSLLEEWHTAVHGVALDGGAARTAQEIASARDSLFCSFGIEILGAIEPEQV